MRSTASAALHLYLKSFIHLFLMCSEALGFGGPDPALVSDGTEALGFGGPDLALVSDGT
jgi:hypothetical protein